MSIWTGCEHHLSDQELAPTHDKLCVFCLSARIRELEATLASAREVLEWAGEDYEGEALNALSAECFDVVANIDRLLVTPSETFDEPSGMEIAQREADEAAGDADPRDRVKGAK